MAHGLKSNISRIRRIPQRGLARVSSAIFRPLMSQIVPVLLSVLCTAGAIAAESIDFVDVREQAPSVILDIRYATPNNFTGKSVYPVARCLLRRDAAMRLIRVQDRLQKQGYRLVVLDCYRPLSIQKRFWELMPDERYVADPVKGSRHNRGAAVDVTLADSTGRELAMPTKYDDFSEAAHRGNQKWNPEVARNSLILENAMKIEGFEPFPTEWWHYDAPGWERYPVSDFPLEKSRGCGD
jgi:D-alanyl-D-alanine dipeptidase